MSNKLLLSPYAWAKLVYLRDKGDTEIAVMGVTQDGNPSIVEDVLMLKQEVSVASVEFDGEDIADYIEYMLAKGISPDRCCRVWIHTHPGNSALPSGTDETTFSEIFGTCPWAIMAILAKGGATTTRLAVNGQWNVAVEMTMQCDWTQPFEASDHDAWDDEYDEFVTKYVAPQIAWKKGWKQTSTGLIKTYRDFKEKDWIVCCGCDNYWEGYYCRTTECPECKSLNIQIYEDYCDGPIPTRALDTRRETEGNVD